MKKMAYKIINENATYFKCDKCGEVLYRIIGEPLGGKPDITIGGSNIRGASGWKFCPYCGEKLYET